MEESFYETTILRHVPGLSLERTPDETSILNFRHLLEKHDLAAGILGVIADESPWVSGVNSLVDGGPASTNI